MQGLLNTNSDSALKACLQDTLAEVGKSGSSPAKLTYAALAQFERTSEEKGAPEQTTPLKEAVVRTGAYYFGPMFVLDKGTGIPSNKIIDELDSKGFYTKSLQHLNNAQLNLFFITLKCRGLVSDRHFMGYVKYGV